ncbi:MAG: hypothetical protein WCH35_17010 [Comamonadaceae bacterium]
MLVTGLALIAATCHPVALVIIMVVALAAEYAMALVGNRLAKWRPAPLPELH